MPYDLIVRGFSKVPLDQLKEAIRAKPWWEIEGDAAGVLLTDNNTGVYVTLAPAQRKAPDLLYPISYNRPRFFALEALLTIADLARTCGWTVHDPQRGADAALSNEEIDAVLDAWQTANDSARRSDEGRPLIARAEALRVWRWNYRRPAAQEHFANEGRDVYVPRIFFVREGNAARARTMLLWPPGVSTIAVPPVDYIVYREKGQEDGACVDRTALLNAAAYYVSAAGAPGGVPVVDAPRFSLLLSSLEKAKCGAFSAEIAAADMLAEE